MSKTVLISGATSGFGLECVKIFSKNGFNIVAIARRQQRLKELEESYENIYTISLDIQNKKDIKEAIDNLPNNYKEIDILINNAGLALGMDKVQDANVDDWDVMVDTNIKGTLYLTNAVLPIMVKNNHGYIFNLGSIAGNWPYEGGNIYGSTKAFIQQFSRNLKTDLFGTKIRVSNIQPGLAKTEFSNVRFKGDTKKADAVYEGANALMPQDIANLIFTLYNLPEHVNVNELEVMPVSQAWAGLKIDKK